MSLFLHKYKLDYVTDNTNVHKYGVYYVTVSI